MKKILLGLVVCAAFCACSNDDVVLSNPATSAIGGDGYISLAINLPTTSSTRANDVYDDGLDSEYAVNDATLLLFEGTNEDNAVCYETYTLATSFQTVGTTTDNITSRDQITQEIDTPVSGNLYALVILNDNGMASKVGGYIGKSLEHLQTVAVDLGGVDAMTNSGFYMCNAPLISTPGGTADPSEGTVTTLAYIDASNIYQSKALAEANPATEIYVERGMAKVTMTVESNLQVPVGSESLDITIDGFALDQTNNVTYPVRNTHTADTWWGLTSAGLTPADYRFAGSVLVGSTTTEENNTVNLYRTYWAYDPNYDVYPYTEDAEGNKTYSGMTSIIGDDDIKYGGLGEGSPQYCLENTFNVAHQNQDETTRAIVKATIDTGGDDFYIWDNNKSLLYDWDDMVALIETVFSEVPAVEAALDPDESYISTNEFFSTYVTVSLKEEDVASDDAEFVITITGLTGDEFKDGEIPEVFGDGLQDVVDELNATHAIGYYVGGECYYSVLIKHFGDDQTPWDLDVVTGSGVDASDVNVSYPTGAYNGSDTPEQNWLGRYGVLRNNWYDVNVTAVQAIGSATPPEATGKPDDPTETWISVRINILSWAKRTQSVTL